jgi:hypothetical protein
VAAEETLLHRPGRFELHVDGRVCELEYRLEGGRVVFTHTGVPAPLQGRGHAARLVEAGLQWARSQGLEVVPACSYVARHLQRHPQGPRPTQG